MQVSLEAAYAEACQALGEEIVKGRLLTQALNEREDVAEVIEEATEIVTDPKAPDDKANGTGPNASDTNNGQRGSQADKPVPK